METQTFEFCNRVGEALKDQEALENGTVKIPALSQRARQGRGTRLLYADFFLPNIALRAARNACPAGRICLQRGGLGEQEGPGFAVLGELVGFGVVEGVEADSDASG